MKIKHTLLVLCLLSSTAAFAQYLAAGSRDSQPVIYEPPSHPQHADYAPLMQEHSVLTGSYASAQGERRASDFPQPTGGLSLGDYARELKKEHDQLKKASVVWVNQ
jgi:hypothetical protein